MIYPYLIVFVIASSFFKPFFNFYRLILHWTFLLVLSPWIVGKALSARWAEDDYGNGPRLIALPIAVGGYWLLYGSYVHPEYSLFPLFIYYFVAWPAFRHSDAWEKLNRKS